MENLFLLFATTLLAGIRIKRFRTRTIADTGCSIAMPDNSPFHVSKTSADDMMYFAESSDGKSDYGVIVVRFRGSRRPASEWKSLLTDFTNNLHPSFGIEHTTNPEWNYWHPQSPAAIGYTEYGQDKKGKDWKICSWIDGSYLCVAYVKNISESPVKSQDAFLNSFRFAR